MIINQKQGVDLILDGKAVERLRLPREREGSKLSKSCWWGRHGIFVDHGHAPHHPWTTAWKLSPGTVNDRQAAFTKSNWQ
jgi:hypothetical protein